MDVMNDPATQQAYDTSWETHIMADSCNYGIQGSIYQVAHDKDDGPQMWVPIDHTSRVLTPTEQNYSPLERESLAQQWAIEQFRFYVAGHDFTVWTHHQPLIQIYNNKQRPTLKRISKHRDAVQDLQYTMKYLKGEEMPCDYGSRHPREIHHLGIDEQNRLGFDNGQEIYIRRIQFTDAPDAVDIETIQNIALKDPDYQKTWEHLERGTKPSRSQYNRVWGQLCVAEKLILKEDKIVIPDAMVSPGVNLRDMITEIAHEGHPGATNMKRYLRSRVWFPQMDLKVEEITSGCLPCQASTVRKHRDPLIPTEPPDEVWQDCAADHWGPTPEGKYLLVIIDRLS